MGCLDGGVWHPTWNSMEYARYWSAFAAGRLGSAWSCKRLAIGRRAEIGADAHIVDQEGVRWAAVEIGRYSFEGPYTSKDDLQDKSGVYAILCYRNGRYSLIDVGQSARVRTRLANHDRSDCWKRNCDGALTVWVCYTPHRQQAGRMGIEHELRTWYVLPCGTQ